MAQQVHAVQLSPRLRNDVLLQLTKRSLMTIDTGTILQQVELPLNLFLLGVCFVGDGDVPYLLIRQIAGYTWHIDPGYGIEMYEVDVGEEMPVLQARIDSLAYVMTIDERDYLYPVITVDEDGRTLNINYTDDPSLRHDVDTYARLSRELQLVRDDISVRSHDRRPDSPSIYSDQRSRPNTPPRPITPPYLRDYDVESEDDTEDGFVRISYASLRAAYRPPNTTTTLVRSMLYNPIPVPPPQPLETRWSTFYAMDADLRHKIRHSLNFPLSHGEWRLSDNALRGVGMMPRPSGGVYQHISHMCNDPESRLLQSTEWEHMIYMIDKRYIDLGAVCSNGLGATVLSIDAATSLEMAKDVLYLFGRAVVTFREWKRETADENELLMRVFPDKIITVVDYSYLNTFKYRIDQRENVRMVLGLINGALSDSNREEWASVLALIYMVTNRQLPGSQDAGVDDIHVLLRPPESGLSYLVLLALIIVVSDR
ncbi:P7 [Mycoreovirus 3]|uniref:P7 n=1 Tax=Rosellinia necatrix mycoreovirus 3 (isolate W370) TaxID=311229 RepID=Q8JXF3_MYRVW|nr:P7 [Mycoreovirus 3]BAC07520.1 P7 [Mycoreovirus 3]